MHMVFDPGAIKAHIGYPFQLPVEDPVKMPAKPVILHIAVDPPDQEVKFNGINDIPFCQRAGF
jgi:hypothetical protein